MDKFTIEPNGYSVKEVNKFVSDVISQTESILSKLKEQKNEIDRLNKELEKYKDIEKNLTSALYKSEEQAQNIRKSAYEEKEVIINDAKTNASRIVNDALLRAEKADIKADNIERNIRIFKKKLKLIVEQQLSVVDEIEELEIEK
jgi:cell division initiation protein